MKKKNTEYLNQVLSRLRFVGMTLKGFAINIGLNPKTIYYIRGAKAIKEDLYNYVMSTLKTEYSKQLEIINGIIERDYNNGLL